MNKAKQQAVNSAKSFTETICEVTSEWHKKERAEREAAGAKAKAYIAKAQKLRSEAEEYDRLAKEAAPLDVIDIDDNLSFAIKASVTEVLAQERLSRDAPEKAVERWDRISRTKYSGKGWADLARIDGYTEPAEVKSEAKKIEKAVKSYRKKTNDELQK
jgi:hypothetical protein